MKTALLLLLSIVSTYCAPAQPMENATYKTITSQFEKSYNAGDYEAIFNSFSTEMQVALPIDKTTGFFKGLKQQVGNLTSRTLLIQDEKHASYKATFERAVFTLNMYVDDNQKIAGLNLKPYTDNSQPKPARNTTQLILPFTEEWTVVWGGDTKKLNYHVENQAQKNAFDIVMTNSAGKSYKTSGKTNADYYAFSKQLIAPCNAVVIMVVDTIPDNVPGTMNPTNPTGNTVLLQTPNNEYLLFAHFKQGSIVVKKGQQVTKGQLLGLCGNSGNSSEPHLHFHVQNIADLYSATGIKCYFEKMLMNGKMKTDYSPIQGERIKNP